MPVTNNDYLGHDQSRAKLMHVWAANVIKRWIQEIEAQEISHPDKLISSLRKRVYNAAGGDQTKIVFTLLNYGRFVDLGVGRGEKYNRRKHDPGVPDRNIQKHPDSNTRLSHGCCLYSNNVFIRWPLY